MGRQTIVKTVKVASIGSKRNPFTVGGGERNCDCRYERDDASRKKPFLQKKRFELVNHQFLEGGQTR